MPNPDANSVAMTPGAFVRARRKHLGHTRMELADLCGVAYARICAIEADEVRPAGWEADAIAGALHDDFDVLFELLDGRPIRLCHSCGCHEHAACVSPRGNGARVACHWVGDNLCSACAPDQPVWIGVDRGAPGGDRSGQYEVAA